MNYTSPSPANVGLNGNQTTWWIPARNLSTKAVDNVVVTVTVSPTTGLAPVTYLADVGTFNFTTGKWNIGKLAPGAVKWLKIVTSVTDIGLAPWTITSVITGDGIDVNNVNNTLVQTLTSVVCDPTAGANDSLNLYSTINVSNNDQACNYGVTEWRLDASSVTNSVSYNWDTLTGIGNFTHVDPTLPITGKYTIWCNPGSGFIEVSGPANFSLIPLIENKNIFNHVPYFIQGSDLTPEEIAILQAQYPSITGIADVCWNIIRNGDGVLTGGIPVDCSEEQDTRTFFECTTEACPATSPCSSCPQSYLPDAVYTSVMDAVNHEPELGDTIFLQHPTGHSIHKWDGSMWVRSECGCVSYLSPYPTAITVTGGATKTVTITMSEGPPLTTTFTDLNTNTNTTYTLVPNVDNTAFDLVDNNNNVVSTITFPITNCQSLNFALTESSGGPGDQVFLYVDGIDNTSSLWDTWVWQYALNYQYDETATWVDAQTGGNSYTIATDDTSVRVVLTNGTCVYYSNVSGDYPSIAGDNWGTQVIQHAPCSIASGDGTVSSPLVVDAPVPTYYFVPNILQPSTTEIVALSTIFPNSCAGGCTATYEIEAYPTSVYASVVINGANVEITTVASPPSGNYPVIINRTCAITKEQGIISISIDDVLPLISYGLTAPVSNNLDGTWREFSLVGASNIVQGFSLVSGTYRIPKTGLYEVSYGGSIYAGTNAGSVKVGIFKNTLLPLSDTIIPLTLSDTINDLTTFSYTKIIECTANDYVFIAIKRDNNILPLEFVHLEGFTYNIKLVD